MPLYKTASKQALSTVVDLLFLHVIPKSLHRIYPEQPDKHYSWCIQSTALKHMPMAFKTLCKTLYKTTA